jgi:hypothetical protein
MGARMDAGVLPYAALALMLSALTMALRLNSGGVFVFHQAKVAGRFGAFYRTYLSLILITAPLLLGALAAAYWLLDWRMVLGLQIGFTVLGALVGAFLWRIWARRALRAPMTETVVFYILAVLGAGWLLADLVWPV